MSAPAGGEAAGGRGDARASTRVRKASAAMAYADAETRQQACALAFPCVSARPPVAWPPGRVPCIALTHAYIAAAAQAAAARLDALENDNAAAEGGAGDDSDDYVLADDLEGAHAAAH